MGRAEVSVGETGSDHAAGGAYSNSDSLNRLTDVISIHDSARARAASRWLKAF